VEVFNADEPLTIEYTFTGGGTDVAIIPPRALTGANYDEQAVIFSGAADMPTACSVTVTVRGQLTHLSGSDTENFTVPALTNGDE
jgi:hypothetical protein